MPPESPRRFVEDNRDLIADVLRYSQDTYARACALVLLQYGSERDLKEIQSDLNLIDDQSA